LRFDRLCEHALDLDPYIANSVPPTLRILFETAAQQFQEIGIQIPRQKTEVRIALEDRCENVGKNVGGLSKE
jgi:hypothetical protein